MLLRTDRFDWVAVDDRTTLPRYWAAVWEMLDGNGLASSTLSGQLRGIDALYRHADEVSGYGALDDAIADLDLDRLEHLLESFFFLLRNQRAGISKDARWQSALGFVRDVIVRINGTLAAESHLSLIESRFDRIDSLYAGLQLARRPPAPPVRALPSAVLEDLYEVFSLDSRRNPFSRPATRWRAFTAFVLLLHQGLRQGEVLILSVTALKAEKDATGKAVHWLDVLELEGASPDPRYSRPSIKTVQSIRQIPVSSLTASILERYRTDWRGRQPHTFLLASKNRRPLSKEGLTRYLAQASAALSPAAKRTLRDRTHMTSVSPHDLRHTCATIRMRQLLDHGFKADEASQQLRGFFGWSADSDMPRHYAKAAFDDRLMRVWGDEFDKRIEMLRSLPE